MNTYKITFERENGTVGSDKFTAATEAQARKDFREVYRHGNGHITSVELISTDTPATKEQERKALEKIRKIILELGENSYIGTAFEGCLQDAEDNIENDFAFSMKARYETAEEKAEEFKRSAEYYSAEHEKAEAKIKALQEQVERLEAKALRENDIDACLALAQERRSEYEQMAEDAARKIVEIADTPDNPEFKQAVSDHRDAKRAVEKNNSLIQRLSAAR